MQKRVILSVLVCFVCMASLVGCGGKKTYKMGEKMEFDEDEGEYDYIRDEEADDDDESYVRARSKYLVFHPKVKDLVFIISMMFEDAKQFKQAIINYTVVTQR